MFDRRGWWASRPVSRPTRVLTCLLALTLTAAAAATPADPQAGASSTAAATGAINGVVLDGHDETPVPEAVVFLTGRVERRVAVSLQVVADERGRFVFRDLPAAAYQLSVEKAGYTSRRAVTGGKASYFYLSLATGESASNARAWLWRHASLSGRVLDERGEAMVGTPVRAFAEVFIGGRPRYVASNSAVADDRGEFHIANLPPGAYYVVWFPQPGGLRVAGRAGTGELAYPATYHPAARDTSNATRVTLEPGEERMGADISVEPVATGRVEGQLDGPLHGLVGLRLRLRQADAADLGFGYEAATALIQRDGTFAFTSVPVGRYLIEALSSHYDVTFGSLSEAQNVRARAPGTFVEMWGPGRPIGFGGGLALTSAAGDLRLANSGRSEGGWVRAEIEVRAGTVEKVVVPVHPTISLSGRVILEDSPEVAAATYVPAVVALMSLVAEPVDPSFGLTHPSHSPNDDGSFHIGGLLPGEYFLSSRGLSRTVKSILWNGDDYADRPFDASAGRSFTDIAVTLTSKQSPFPVTGTIRDSRGRAVPSAIVAAFPVDRARWNAYGVVPRRLGSVTADEGGAFRISGLLPYSPLPAGDYYLLAVRHLPVDWMNTSFLEAAAALATPVSVDWGGTRDVSLELRELVGR